MMNLEHLCMLKKNANAISDRTTYNETVSWDLIMKKTTDVIYIVVELNPL